MAEPRMKIIVVDDDARLRDLLNRYLTEQGYAVRVVHDATEMNRQLARERYDLMILDLMLPGEDGLSICRRLRGGGENMPIIMLTAKGDDVDRIVGLEVGADDYLPKPFNPRELVARIQAVLRRRPAPTPPGAPSGEVEIVEFGPFRFNLATRSLARNKEDVPLTSGEFALLKLLVQHPRTPLSRDSGVRGCCTRTLSSANSPEVRGTSSLFLARLRVARLKRNGPNSTISTSPLGAPGGVGAGRRRSTA